MQVTSVAKRYAQALYNLTVEEGATEAVRADLASILELIGNTPELSSFIDNPTIAPDVAEQAVRSLFKEQAHALTLQLLVLLASRSRLNQLRAICTVYEQYICIDQGILKVQITAAHELSDAQQEAIKQKLNAQYNKTIDAEVDVDPALIGGFKILVGDRIRDYSIAAKLEQFEQCVIGAKHEHPKQKVKSWR